MRMIPGGYPGQGQQGGSPASPGYAATNRPRPVWWPAQLPWPVPGRNKIQTGTGGPLIDPMSPAPPLGSAAPARPRPSWWPNQLPWPIPRPGGGIPEIARYHNFLERFRARRRLRPGDVPPPGGPFGLPTPPGPTIPVTGDVGPGGPFGLPIPPPAQSIPPPITYQPDPFTPDPTQSPRFTFGGGI